MSAPPCPNDEVLARHALGTLADVERSRITEHLAGCESCRGRAATLPNLARISMRPTVELHLSSTPLERGTRVGRYVILQLIGSGAMGFVYEASDPELERKVALKLLRTSRRTGEAQSRLLREAQAMARLSHPNVVPVFDVGTTDAGDVFVAMQLVHGQTLSEWCESPRGWREILRCFLAAGRGLAAAHAAGLVHRDFKPHNVLVGEDGSVRVTDFGLVRLVSDSETGTPRDLAPAERIEAPLTRDGVLMGTPQYMSPEQLSGEKVDPRSDQFSFCVALYEALHREPPFRGESLHELLAHQQRNQIRDPPSGTRVPQWVRRPLLRGLRHAPDERFATMESLLAALDRDPARGRRKVAIAAALGALLAAPAAMQLLKPRAPSPCVDVVDRISRAWNPEKRASLSAAYRALGKPFAEDTFRAVDGELSAYGRRWSLIARSTCEAARVRDQVPEDAYSRQRDCLELRAKEVSTFVALLTGSDPETLAHGVRSVRSLAPLEECAQLDASTVRLSPDWAMHPAEQEALRAGLAATDAQNALGHYPEAAATVDRTLAQAPHLNETPLAANLLQQRAYARYQVGDAVAAASGFEQAALIAERLGDDAQAADAWIGRGLAAMRLAQYDQASQDLSFAKAKLDRLGNAFGAERLRWLNAMSGLAFQRGRYAEAAAQLRGALADRSLPWTPLQEATSREQIANAEKEMGNDERAAEDYAQALAISERELGKSHPQLASLYGELAVIRHHQKRDPEARALYQRALAIDETAYGKDSLDSASWLNNLAVIEADAGQGEAALELLHRVLQIKERVLGADHPSVAVSLINESTGLIELRRYRAAEDDLNRAAQILIARKGTDHPDLIAVYTDLGAAQRGEGHHDQADVSFERALEIARLRLRPNHPWVSDVWSERGENDLARARWRSAAEDYEHALEVDAANKVDGTGRARSVFGLARALMKLGRDPSRARDLAREALAGVESRPAAQGPTAEDVRRWLRAHAAVAPAR